MNWNMSLSWTITQTKNLFFIIFLKKNWTFLPWAKFFFEKPNTKTLLKLGDPKALSLYSLISNSLFSHGWNSNCRDLIPLSLLSSQTQALSLLSWPIHLMTENPWPIIFSKSMAEDPWPNPKVVDPKTHGQNPRLSSHPLSLSLSLSLFKALSLVRIV